MLNKEKVFNILKEELPYLRNTFSIKRIGVFGSFANGNPQKESDIDLLVEFERLPALRFITFVDYLEGKLGRAIDVLTPGGLAGIRVAHVAESIRKSLRYV